MLQIMAVVNFLAAAIQVPQHGSKVNAGGIHQRFIGEIEGGENGEQFSANRANTRIELPGVHQSLYEIGQQQDVRIESQHPSAGSEPDSLVLRGGESNVLVVIDDLAAILELLQYVHSAIGGGIVDDN